MSIEIFAATHRLKSSRDKGDDTTVIVGRIGHLYEYSSTELGVMVVNTSRTPRPRKWSALKQKCEAVGMVLRQNGEDEGAFSFDPNHPEQAKVAIQVSRVRVKKVLSDACRALLTERMSKLAADRRLQAA